MKKVGKKSTNKKRKIGLEPIYLSLSIINYRMCRVYETPFSPVCMMRSNLNYLESLVIHIMIVVLALIGELVLEHSSK